MVVRKYGVYGNELYELILRTLTTLSEKEDRAYSVGEIRKAISLPTHRDADIRIKLGEAVSAGKVSRRKEGRYVYYRLVRSICAS